jgi:hypothetical protein
VRPRGPRGAVLASATLVVVVASLVAVPRAWAWWTDTASGTGTLGARTISAPNLQCAGYTAATKETAFTWTATPGATSYTFYYAGTSKTVTGTAATTVPTKQSANTAWVVANVDFGQTTWSSVPSHTRTYSYSGLVGSCS